MNNNLDFLNHLKVLFVALLRLDHSGDNALHFVDVPLPRFVTVFKHGSALVMTIKRAAPLIVHIKETRLLRDYLGKYLDGVIFVVGERIFVLFSP
jgi:hypothetical protein